MTKRVNRKYFVCVEDEGVVYTHKFTKGYRCGGYYYTLSKEGGTGIAITEDDIKSSVIDGLSSGIYAQNSLIKYYKRKLPKGERPKVFLKRIYEKDMKNMRMLK